MSAYYALWPALKVNQLSGRGVVVNTAKVPLQGMHVVKFL